jgi:hypothetical protein
MGVIGYRQEEIQPYVTLPSRAARRHSDTLRFNSKTHKKLQGNVGHPELDRADHEESDVAEAKSGLLKGEGYRPTPTDARP